MSHIENKNHGLLLAVASPLCFATFNAGLRIVSAQITIYGLMFLRGLVGMALVLIISKLMNLKLNKNRKLFLLSIGFVSAFSTVATTTAITLIPLYQAVVILYLYPAITVPLGYVLGGDKITPRSLAGVVAAIIGCVLLVWPDSQAGLNLHYGHAIGLLGATLYALSFIMTRKLGSGYSGLEPFFTYSLASFLISWPLSKIIYDGLGIDNQGEVLLGLALVWLGAAAQLMAFAALRFLPPFRVGVIGTLEVLLGALCSWLLFNDPFTVRALIGAIIIVYAAFGFGERK
ncbi:MAG: DMT family transporter [Deltaproteobacteria bacterium]|jgi:S-adenosylmethionine uptake transporter|nr:DMT family transporter [Deltaproteobacteria bacterium]